MTIRSRFQKPVLSKQEVPCILVVLIGPREYWRDWWKQIEKFTFHFSASCISDTCDLESWEEDWLDEKRTRKEPFAFVLASQTQEERRISSDQVTIRIDRKDTDLEKLIVSLLPELIVVPQGKKIV